MRKVMSFILSTILLISTCCFQLSVYAAEPASIKVTDTSCIKGEQTTAEVMLNNNPGMCFMSLTPVCYDVSNNRVTDISLSVKNGTIFSMTNGKNPVWDSDEDVSTNGLLCTLTITVPTNVSSGEYKISFIPRGCYNYDEEDVELNIVAGKLMVKGNETALINPYKDQIRFQKNTDGTYAGKFDYRTLAMISEEDFKATFESEENALKMIQEIGFVYATIENVPSFNKNAATALVENDVETMGYVKVPVNYISTAFSGKDNTDADYVISCIVTNIDDVDAGLHALAYIKYTDKNGETKYSYYDTATTSLFKPLFDQHFGSAFPA